MSPRIEDERSRTLHATLRNARRTLLEQRGEHGHWEGELSSSALSTATAIIALESYWIECHAPTSRLQGASKSLLADIQRWISAGRAWLVQHQNPDGGWGDTVLSISNISTTALGWGALRERSPSHPDAEPDAARSAVDGAVQRCEAWIRSQVGSLQPKELSAAITARYGKDKTFSVPILTALALTGRLGSEESAWRWIPQLPFELAAFPHQWFALLKLPVVSYALPALIAMGQVRHLKRPTWNPLLRIFRQLVWNRTQRVLGEIQPTTGGFLEATPLTSFVLMTLLGARAEPRPVIELGIDFLVRSARSDGSWPIDTNLATWTTTLSMNALAKGSESAAAPFASIEETLLPPDAWTAIRKWLFKQQYRVEHPFTHARPGGWAWTDLAGGVPDADDTSGALLAIRIGASLSDRESARSGVRWLLDLQNSDGGIPTFCKGWGALPFDRSSTDITAHAVRAWIAWYDQLDSVDQRDIERGIARAWEFIARSQLGSGAWAPLWFGNQHANPEENLVYGTSRVLLACSALMQHPKLKTNYVHRVPACAQQALQWLLRVQNGDGGWGGDAGIVSSIEETALAVEALCEGVALCPEHRAELLRAIDAGIAYLADATREGTCFPASPIGFYFAKLWYFERMYPLVFTVAALGAASRLSGLHTPSAPREVTP